MSYYEGYKRDPTTITVNRKLTREEFEEVELLLNQPLGRYKPHAERYVFTCEAGHILNTLLNYLRRIKAPHQMELVYTWEKS